MKQATYFLSIFLLLFADCTQGIVKQNYFSSDLDTLIIRTEKIKGSSLISDVYWALNFSDTTDAKNFKLIFPNNISDIQISTEPVDFKLWMKHDFYGNSDSVKVPTPAENSISFMKGIKDGKNIFIVDENNNKDFRDDSIRIVGKFETKSNSNLICCKYHIFNGIKTIQDSGWINVGFSDYYDFAFSVAHHLESKITLDEQSYSIDIVNSYPYFRFCFENPVIAIVEKNGVRKDSVTNDDKIGKDDFIQLGDNYYYLADIANDGSTFKLIKEKDVSNKINTQIGFIAPDFVVKTITGDTLRLSDYKGKYLLLANVSSCWSQKSSYECFKELSQVYESKINIIGIDNSPNTLNQQIKALKIDGQFVIDDENISFKNNYRKTISSRTCFLISPDGHIADNFEIFDWEMALNKHFYR